MSRKLFRNHDHQSCDYPEFGNQYHHSHNLEVLQNQTFSRNCTGRGPSVYRTHGKYGMIALQIKDL